MKSNELRLENIITRKGILYEDKTFHKIIVSSLDIMACCLKPDDFNPIPLTEEWLLKAGFEKDLSYFTIDGLDGVFFEYDSDFIGHRNENICGDYDECVHIRMPKSVHQLQNLYFALTGEELKINI